MEKRLRKIRYADFIVECKSNMNPGEVHNIKYMTRILDWRRRLSQFRQCRGLRLGERKNEKCANKRGIASFPIFGLQNGFSVLQVREPRWLACVFVRSPRNIQSARRNTRLFVRKPRGISRLEFRLWHWQMAFVNYGNATQWHSLVQVACYMCPGYVSNPVWATRR